MVGVHVEQRLTVNFKFDSLVIVNYGSPIDFQLSHGTDSWIPEKGKITVTFEKVSSINSSVIRLLTLFPKTPPLSPPPLPS